MHNPFYVWKIADVRKIIFVKSFTYSLIELLSFPEENSLVQEIYDRHQIERIFVYHILTDTDSTSLQYLVVSSVQSTFTEDEVRNILLEIFSKNEIRDRFDKSDKFWEQFGVWESKNQKVLGLHEVESISDSCLMTLAVNPKEYYEYLKIEDINKKHEGIKKGSAGMDFKNYAERIKPLFDFESYKKPKKDTKAVVRISVKKGEMTTHQLVKSKFSQLNEKRFYFPNAIVSLPFGHSALNELDKYKKNKGQRIEDYFLQDRKHLLELEKKALKKCPRLDFLNNILLQSFKVVNKDNLKDYLYNPSGESVLESILDQGWKRDSEIRPTTENSTKMC